MARVNINGAVRGDTLRLRLTTKRKGVIVDITGCKIWFTIKYSSADADTDAIVSIDSESGGIVLTDPTNGIAIATVAPEVMDSIPSYISTLQYDIQVLEADGTLTTTAYGDINFVPDITRKRA